MRQICLAFPGVREELDGFGCTTFKVTGRSFVRMSEGEAGCTRIALKASLALQQILLDTGRFARAPYVGRFGWVSVRGEVPVRWDELAGLFMEAYLLTAPKRLGRRLLERNPSMGPAAM